MAKRKYGLSFFNQNYGKTGQVILLEFSLVSKLLNIIEPDYAVFGKKDYQQLILVELVQIYLFEPIF